MNIDLDRKFEVFFDGECHLCTKEINLLRWLDRKGRIVFTDIADSGFDAQSHTGLTYDMLMEAIHGRIVDGPMVEGVEVFRQLYGRVGFRWGIWMTRLPIVKQSLDFGYHVFAKNRLRWTGRCQGGECQIHSEKLS